MESFGLDEKELLVLRRVFEGVPQLLAVYVFGSRARGDHKGTSDLDFAVEFDGDDAGKERGLYKLRDSLEESSLKYKCDVVDISRLKGDTFQERVMRERKLLYRRGE